MTGRPNAVAIAKIYACIPTESLLEDLWRLTGKCRL